jgi:GT2 family glycosyltransferase
LDRAQVDIIIPVYNQPKLTEGCLKSIREHSDLAHNIILVDNASDSATRQLLDNVKASNTNVSVIRNADNLGWVRAVNQGIRASRSPYVCIMNNDTVVHTDKWLSGLVNVAERAKDIGLVNPRFETKKKVPKGAFIEVDFCRGYCVLIKREVIDRIGVLDEAYGLGYYDDDDFSVRAIRAGYRCVRANDVYVEHLRDSTFSAVFSEDNRRRLHEKNKALFYSKWGKRLKILVIMTKKSDRARVKDTLFSLARNQHVVYVWRSVRPQLALCHINIRERSIPKLVGGAMIRLGLVLDNKKRPGKKFDIIFVDNNKLAGVLSRARPGIHYAGAASDSDRIVRIVKEASRV